MHRRTYSKSPVGRGIPSEDAPKIFRTTAFHEAVQDVPVGYFSRQQERHLLQLNVAVGRMCHRIRESEEEIERVKVSVKWHHAIIVMFILIILLGVIVNW